MSFPRWLDELLFLGPDYFTKGSSPGPFILTVLLLSSIIYWMIPKRIKDTHE
jgi:hypothetical protein